MELFHYCKRETGLESKNFALDIFQMEALDLINGTLLGVKVNSMKSLDFPNSMNNSNPRQTLIHNSRTTRSWCWLSLNVESLRSYENRF